MTETFGEDYFLRGTATGVSNYTNYQWMEKPTIRMASHMMSHLGIKKGDSLLDVGCARGYLVKAMRLLSVEAYGYDISKWAVKNCDPAVTGLVSNHFNRRYYDFVISKDQAEHCRTKELGPLLNQLLSATRQAMLLIVPLSEKKDGPYVRKEDNLDSTHIIRWPLEVWMEYLFMMADDHSFTLKGSWHMSGLKPTSRSAFKSCGFFELRKLPAV